jgi:hypothetical protein
LDDTYQVYVNRVTRMTLPEAYKSQVQYIQPSPKFVRQPDRGFQPAPFPGYSVITPPWAEESNNTGLYTQVQACQTQLLERLPAQVLVPVPPASFHLTLADLIWDSAYRHVAEDGDFDDRLCRSIDQIFQRCQPLVQGEDPVTWQVLGLIVMTRGISLALAPKAERSYARVVELRRSLYQNIELMNLGIEQQYHFTGHITLGYFGDTQSLPEADQISEILTDLNQSWLDSDHPQELHVHRAELRKFEDMTDYYRADHWPVLQFQ